MINSKRLHIRKDGQPVTSNQVYAVTCRFPDIFVKAEGRILYTSPYPATRIVLAGLLVFYQPRIYV